ncbi:uncharacterized protein TNCV_3808791 [Trichonephila clavipes]|nr:uncharacterized protein TNCV_3808791 [Trichonephila clavipes]
MWSRESVTGKASRKINDIIAFSIWVILIAKRKILCRLLKDVHTLGINSNAPLKPHVLNIGAVAIFAVPLAAWMFKILPLQVSDCELLARYFLIRAFNVESCTTWYIIALFLSFFLLTLRTFVAVIYILICIALRRVLITQTVAKSEMVKNLSVRFDAISFQYHLAKNESVIEVLRLFEKTMSFPIFLTEISDLFEMFLGFTWLDSRNHLTDEHSWLTRYAISTCFSSLRAFLFFLCISLAASGVHDASKKCKEVHETILKGALISKSTVSNRDILQLLIMHQSPTFKLSALGFFYFTKGFILSAIGSVLTYSLLIIQIDSSSIARH